MDDDLSALAHQEELEHQQWLDEWIGSKDHIDFVNNLIYDILSTNPTYITEFEQ